MYKGVKLAESNDLKRSIECFTMAIQTSPEWASAYNNRAQALRLSGDWHGTLFVCLSLSFFLLYTSSLVICHCHL